MKIFEAGRKRSTLILLVGGYLNTAILVIQGLLLVPFYLHFIGAHTYGLWLATGGILGLLGILNFGIGNILTQRIASAYGKNNTQDIGLYFTNGAVVYLLVFTVFISVGIFLSYFLDFLNSGSELPIEFKGCFQLALLAVGLSILNECTRSFSQAVLQPTLSIFSIAISRVIGTMASIVALYQGYGLWAIPLGMVVCELLIFIFGIFLTIGFIDKFQMKLILDFSIVKEYFKDGGAMFAASVGSSFARESDPILITYILSPEITAAYMISRRAADILFQLLAVFSGSIHSSFSHLIGQGDLDRISKIGCKLLTTITVLSFVGFLSYMYLNTFFVGLWVGKNYQISQNVIVIMGLGFLTSSLRTIVWQLLNGFGDFNYSSSIVFLEGLIKVLLSALALNYIGLLGVPLAFLVTSIFSMGFLYFKLREMIVIRLDHVMVFKFILLTLILSLISSFITRGIAVDGWLKLTLIGLVVMMMISFLLAATNNKFFRRFLRGILDEVAPSS